MLVTLLAVVVVAFAAASPASACEAAMPTSEIAAGMTGTGWTVARGQTREPFNVEVLGVLRDGIGPGRDMIVVQASSPSITAAGGIWYGMSGSPVYIGGRLAGALAYGFSATSSVAGLTPAEDMAGLLALRSSGLVETPETVVVPRPLARKIAARTGAEASEVDALTQLRLPLSVSGLNARGMREVRAWAEKEKLSVLPFSGTAARSAVVSAAPPQAGDNFAAVAAYGDVTLSGIGTTTWSCGDQALAFGHPFLFSGTEPSGANAASAFAVVPDSLWGPFKFAAVGETFGTVDQDRMAGLRARAGQAPPTFPIRSYFASADTGAGRQGATDVVQRDLMSMATFFHLISNIDTTHDAIGRGTAALNWLIEGKRADGTPWRLAHGNLVASRFDVAIEAADAVAMEADMLGFSFEEDVRVTAVSVEGSVDDAVRQYTLTKVLIAKGRRGKFKNVRRSLVVTPGNLLRIRVFLKRFEDGSLRRIDLQMRVPRRGRPFGMLSIGGGMFSGGGGECEEEGCGGMFGSFDDLLKTLEKRPRNDELTLRLRTGERGRLAIDRKLRLDGVILGARGIFLRPPGSEDCCDDEEKPPPEG